MDHKTFFFLNLYDLSVNIWEGEECGVTDAMEALTPEHL